LEDVIGSDVRGQLLFGPHCSE